MTAAEIVVYTAEKPIITEVAGNIGQLVVERANLDEYERLTVLELFSVIPPAIEDLSPEARTTRGTEKTTEYHTTTSRERTTYKDRKGILRTDAPIPDSKAVSDRRPIRD